jgi:hypothetical protein
MALSQIKSLANNWSAGNLLDFPRFVHVGVFKVLIVAAKV